MSSGSEAVSAGQIFLLEVARPDWTPERDEHLFAHAFGNTGRVLGFGGKLLYRDGAIHLDQFVGCCTGELGDDRAIAFREETTSRIDRAGWEAQAPPSDSPVQSSTWRSGDSELTWLESQEAGGVSRHLVHLVLTHGTPEEAVFRRVFTLVSEHIPGLKWKAEPVRPVDSPAPGPGTEMSPGDLARAIEGRRPIIYTGAGVSRASGIATFEGEGSLGVEIPLHEAFPGAALDWMIQQPGRLAAHFGAFQARLLSAKPNQAHRAIARLERLHPVHVVVTNNFDKLHEAAGSRVVRRPHDAGGPIPGESTADLLLVSGISTDEHHLIERFRRNAGQVIAIDPVPPRFLQPADGYIRGPAEVVFPNIVECLLAERAAAVSPPARAPWGAEGFQELVRTVQSVASTSTSSLHGDRHWRRVAWLGASLAGAVPGCDPWIVLAFALLHDSRRVNEDLDPDHGRRAAAFARSLNSTTLGLEPRRLELLERACCFHTDGDVSRDPTVGVCWDGDRLDLWRCGMRPEPRYLSTVAALDPERIEWSGRPGAPPEWRDLYEQFDRL